MLARIPARFVLTRYASDCETGIQSKEYDVRDGALPLKSPQTQHLLHARRLGQSQHSAETPVYSVESLI